MSVHISKKIGTMNKSQTDTFVLFRQAATSMSAGILLVIIGSPSPAPYVGFFFFCVSVVFLIAAFSQAFPKWHKFPDTIREFGDNLTFPFILISLGAIIRNWGTILKAVTDGNRSIEPGILWLQSRSLSAIPIWVFAFAVIFCLVGLVDISRGIKSTREKFGIRRTVFRYMAVIGLVAGLWGVSISTLLSPSNIRPPVNLPLLILSMLVVIGMIIYLYKEVGQTRRFYMERKDKARKSAIAVATTAEFISDSLTFNYPPRILKAILSVPLKQLEDELQTLKAYVNALK